MNRIARNKTKLFQLLLCITLVIALTTSLAMVLGSGNSFVAGAAGTISDLVDPTTTAPISVANDTVFPWVADGTYNGGAAYKSNIWNKNNTTSYVTFTFNTTVAGFFCFDYKTSSEQDSDYIAITINGGPDINADKKAKFSGDRAWSKAVVELSTVGAQTIKVGYSKSSDYYSFEDTVWMANAKFILGGKVNIVAESNNTALGAVTGGLQGVAIGTEVTLTAEQTTAQSVAGKFMGWFNASDVKVCSELKYVFTATEAEKMVAKFLPYVVLDKTTLTYGNATKDLIEGETVIDIDPKQIYNYTISIPTVAAGNSIKIVHNGKVVSLDGQGKYVFNCDEMPSNEIVITTTKTNCIEKAITLKTKTTLAQMLGKPFDTSTITNTSTKPWGMVAENGKMVFESGNSGYGALGQTSELTLNFDVAEDKILSLQYFLCSALNNDFGSILFDGAALVDKLSGYQNWTSLIIPLTAGKHVLKFIYTKNNDYEMTLPDMLRICDLSTIAKSELPNISLSQQDGVASPVPLGDIFANGVDKKLPSVTHDHWTNSTRKYLLNFGNLNAQYNYYIKINGNKRIDMANNQITIDNIDRYSVIDIYAEKDGRGKLFANYIIQFSYELKGIINENDINKDAITVNDKNYPFVLDQAKTTEHGRNVYKNSNNQNIAGIDSFFAFDVNVPSDKKYLLGIDYIISSYNISGYEHWWIKIDGNFLLTSYIATDVNCGSSYKDWRNYFVAIDAGQHQVEIGFNRTTAPLSEPNTTESTVWLSNIRLEPCVYPDIILSSEKNGQNQDIAPISINGQLQTINKISIDYWSQIGTNFKLSFSNITKTNIFYVMCGGKQYNISGVTNSVVTIPTADLTSNIDIWIKVNDIGNMWKIATIPVSIKYDINKIVTDNAGLSLDTSITTVQSQKVVYDKVASAALGQGLFVYSLKNYDSNPAMSVNYSYNIAQDMLISFKANQDYYENNGSFQVLVDGALIKDCTQTKPNKEWVNYCVAVPSGMHTLQLAFKLNRLSGGCSDSVKLADLKFAMIPATGTGTEVDPFTTNIDTLFNAGVTAGYTQKFVMETAVNSLYFVFNGITINSVAVEDPASGATVSFVGTKVSLLNIPVKGNTTFVVTATGGSFKVMINNPGIPGHDHISGSGTETNPYIIETVADLALLTTYNTSYFKFGTAGLNLTLSGNWTPIGTEAKPFAGGFDGNGAIISGLNINAPTAKFLGFFGVARDATLKNFTIQSPTIVGKENVNSDVEYRQYIGGIVGYAQLNVNITNCSVLGATISGAKNINRVDICKQYVGGIYGYVNERSTATNCKITGSIAGHSEVGGLVGCSLESALSATGCNVGGVEVGEKTTIKGERANIGGLSGNGGNFNNCYMYADVSGLLDVGGLVGGYKINSTFNGCYMAGSVVMSGTHGNNYPYFGAINGYGAWVAFYLTDTGILLTIKYKSRIAVSAIDIFNCDGGYEQVGAPQTEGEYTKVQYKVKFKAVNASLNLLSETLENGIPGNYGGVVVRFKMADNTFKYISTLDRTKPYITANFNNLDLDMLTSYQDNFASLSINQSTGTGVYKTEQVNNKAVSVFGTVNILSANDFEHLQWHINGGIPTTFAGGIYYNARSIATLSVSLGADLDLTKERLVDGKYLNRVGGLIGGEILNQFYGFGTSEMNPYRGSIYGNNHKLNVNMNFPEAYLVGIIAMSSDMNYQVVVSNLTVTGTIIGKYRVGVVGMFDAYERSGSLKFDNVTNKATMSATNHIGGLIGVIHNAKIYVNNCTIDATITATNAGLFAGSFGNWTLEGDASMMFYSGINKDYVYNLKYQGLAAIPVDATSNIANIHRAIRLRYGTGSNEFVEFTTNDAAQKAFNVATLTIGGAIYNFTSITLTFDLGGGNFKKDFYIFIMTGSLSKAYDGNAEFTLGASNYLGAWNVSGNVVVGGVNASATATAYDVFQTNNLTFGAVDTASVNIVNAGLTATITKKNVTASVANNTVTYNGKDQTTATISGEGFVASEISGGVATFLNHTYSATPKSAGKYTITVALTAAAFNYALTGATVFDYIVNKAEIAVTMPSEYATEKTYGGVDPVWADININGVELSASTFEQVPVKFARNGADQTAGVKVGDITASTTNQNYALNFTAKDFTIKQATPVLTFANATFSYNGNAQSLETAKIAGVAGAENPTGAITYKYYAEQACATEIAKPTNVGVYYVRASYQGDNNYSAVTADATLTITAIAPTVSVAPSASGICVGQTLADSKLTGGVIKGANNEDVVGTFAWKDGAVKPTATASGSYKVVFTTTNSNYNATTEIDVTVVVAQLTVTFVDDSGNAVKNVDYNSAYALSAFPQVTARSYYTVAWNVKADIINIQSNQTVTAIYTPIDYTISYTLDGGTVVSNKDIYNVETADFALNNPTKVGYTFKGWSGTALTGDQNLNVTIAKGGNGNRTYTANWTINQYTFTYSAENGTISTNIVGLVSGGKVDFGTVVTMTATANVGYTFEAWNVDGTDVSTLTTYSVTVGAKDCVVKARFKANDATSYTVLHYTEDLIGGGKTLFATDNLSGKTDTLATATAKIKAGFTAPTIMPNGKIVGDGSLAIEVLYTRNSYNMTIGSAVTLQKFEAEVVLSQETKLGFTFGGWSCSVDGKVYNGSYKMPAQDAVMTAIWTLNAPTVSISGHTSAVTYDPNKTVILTANAGHTLGSSVLSYKWFKGDAEIVGQTGATLSLKNVADSGSYKVVVLATSDGQTKQAEATQVVAINPADLIVTAEAYKQQYDGLAHSIVVTAPAGATIEYSLDNSVWSVTNPTFTNKQSAVVVNYRVNKTNYNQFASNASVTIDARVITVKAQAQTAKYSGLTPTFDNIKWETSVNSIVQGENLGIVLSCKTLGINAGSYPIEVGYSGNEAVRANYQITCINGSFEIEKLAVNIKLLNQNAVFSKAEPIVGNAENTAWQYASQDKFVSADNISFAISKVVGSEVKVDGYVISAKLNDNVKNSNYNVTFQNATYMITAKEVVISIDSRGKIYDREDAVVDTTWTWNYATGKEPCEGDNLGVQLQKAVGRDAGAYDITATWKNDSNYNVTVEKGVFTISPITLEITIRDATSIYSNGQSMLNVAIIGTIIYPDDAVDWIIVDANNQEIKVASANVGEYKIVGKGGKDSKNYTITFKNSAGDKDYAIYTITKKDISIDGVRLKGEQNKVVKMDASGAMLKPEIDNETLPNGVLSYKFMYNNGSALVEFTGMTSGTELITVQFVADGNHAITSAPASRDVTFIIIKDTVTITWFGTDGNFVYNGNKQSDGIYATYKGKDGKDLGRLEATFGDNVEFKNAGEYTATLNLSLEYNIDATSSRTKNLIIDKQAVDMSAIKFNNKVAPYTNTLETLAIEGNLSNLVSVAYQYATTGKPFLGITDAGIAEVSAVFTLADDKNYKLAGIEGDRLTATITINSNVAMENEFYDAVDALPKTITVESFEAVRNAKAKYDALPYVGDILPAYKKTLQSAINACEVITATESVKEKKFTAKVNAFDITTVTTSSFDAIKAMLLEYSALGFKENVADAKAKLDQLVVAYNNVVGDVNDELSSANDIADNLGFGVAAVVASGLALAALSFFKRKFFL